MPRVRARVAGTTQFRIYDNANHLASRARCHEHRPGGAQVTTNPTTTRETHHRYAILLFVMRVGGALDTERSRGASRRARALCNAHGRILRTNWKTTDFRARSHCSKGSGPMTERAHSTRSTCGQLGLTEQM